MQPDLLVARRADFTDKDLSGVPVLVVEILSCSTRQVDLHLKRVVDPEAPSIIVLEIEKGRHVERAHAVGSDEIEVSPPYGLTIKPRDLVA